MFMIFGRSLHGQELDVPAGRPYGRSHYAIRMSRGKPGFVFLISVLIIGAIVTAMSTSLILLGIAAEQNGMTVVQSAQAYEYAQTCAERALLSLRSDLTYDGGETVTFSNGTCTVMHAGGSGNTDRTLCLEGTSGRTTRRLEIAIRKVYPQATVTSWREVSSFTLCP